DEIDDEDEGLATEEVAGSGGTVCEVRRDGELAATADLHTRDALLPALDEHAEGELRGLTTAPRRVELLARLEVDARVVDRDGRAGLRLGTVAHDEVMDLEFGGGGARGSVELRLRAIECHGSIMTCSARAPHANALWAKQPRSVRAGGNPDAHGAGGPVRPPEVWDGAHGPDRVGPGFRDVLAVEERRRLQRRRSGNVEHGNVQPGILAGLDSDRRRGDRDVLEARARRQVGFFDAVVDRAATQGE